MTQTEVDQQVTDVEFQAMTGGISIKFNSEDGCQSAFIRHEDFRPWSYVQGYWNESYYKFLLNLKRPVIERYITDRLKGQKHD